MTFQTVKDLSFGLRMTLNFFKDVEDTRFGHLKTQKVNIHPYEFFMGIVKRV